MGIDGTHGPRYNPVYYTLSGTRGGRLNFRFDLVRTVQAAGVPLALDDGRMGSMRLLKLLYVADRELLAETGRPLTGDNAVAMKHGPVLSRVYDLSKGVVPTDGPWGDHIQTVNYSVVLNADPGRGKLSKGEVEKLHEVTDRFRSLDDFEVSERTHEFPEWRDHHAPGTSTPIPWQDMLLAPGRPEVVAIAERDEAARRFLDELFEDSHEGGWHLLPPQQGR